MTSRIKPIIFFTLLIIALVGCTDKSKQTKSALKLPVDTVYTEQAAMNIYETQPARALAIIDSAEIVGNLSNFRAQLLRAKVFSHSTGETHQDSAMLIGQALLNHDSVEASPMLQREVLELLVNTARMQHNDEQWLHWAIALADLSRQQGNETEALRTDAEIGIVLTHLGRLYEGMEKLDHAISQLDGKNRFNEFNASIIVMKRKINVLSEQGRYAEIIPLAEHIIERLFEYKNLPSQFADGSYREPKTEKAREDYIDFYHAQAMGFLAYAYAMTDDVAKARQYTNMFEHTAYGQSFDGRKMIAPTWCQLGEYDKMFAVFNEMEQYLKGDTINDYYATMLRGHAIAADARGQLTESRNYWRRYAHLIKCLNDTLLASGAQIYAATYHAQEQQQAIQEQEEETMRFRLMAWAGGIIALLTIGVAIFFSQQRRILHKKNRVLVQQISEALELREKYEALQNQQEPAENTEQTAANGSTDLDNMSLEDLSLYLRNAIKREQLFLNPQFGRQAAIDHFHVSKERIGSAFAQGSSYSSISDFIRDCRLDYACHLLVSQPNLSVKAVAAESGFSYASTFAIDFKNKYSVTPTEYRNLKNQN